MTWLVGVCHQPWPLIGRLRGHMGRVVTGLPLSNLSVCSTYISDILNYIGEYTVCYFFVWRLQRKVHSASCLGLNLFLLSCVHCVPEMIIDAEHLLSRGTPSAARGTAAARLKDNYAGSASFTPMATAYTPSFTASATTSAASRSYQRAVTTSLARQLHKYTMICPLQWQSVVAARLLYLSIL